MDPVLIVILAAIGVVTIPKITKVGIAKIIESSNKKKKRKQQFDANVNSIKNKEFYRRQKLQENLEKDGVKVTPVVYNDVFEDLSFKNVKDRSKNITINGREIIKFDETKDALLKGKVSVIDASGKYIERDIYLFQPRLYTRKSNVFIGPVRDNLGHISDDTTYLCRRPDTKEVFSGYIPKREVCSGMRFDYVSSSRHRFDERVPMSNADLRSLSESDADERKRDMANISNYINVDLQKDYNGNLVPVNLNDPAEREAFNKYRENFLKMDGFKAYQGEDKIYKSAKNYFIELQDYASDANNKFLAEHPHGYARPINVTPVPTKSEDNGVKVTNARPAENQYDWYNRYNYYANPTLQAGHNGQRGDMHGGPRGDMHGGSHPGEGEGMHHGR
jgi:hypothetical protein